MENPITRLSSKNGRLKLIVFVLVALVIVVPYVVWQYMSEKNLQTMQSNSTLTKQLDEKQGQLQQRDNVIREQQERLNHYDGIKGKISSYIRSESGGAVSSAMVDKMAMAVMVYSKKEKLPINEFSKLLASESGFNPNVKHTLPYVVGIGGNNAKYWLGAWKQAGIASSADEVRRDPVKSIAASAQELRYYLNMTGGNVFEALVHYKGYSPLGRTQASMVMRKRAPLAMNIKF